MKYFSFLFALIPFHLFAVPSTGVNPNGSLGVNGWTMSSLLSYGEQFLLKAVLPLTVVGVALYVGYHLVTAEGDEEKMKKAFKSLTYSAVGLIAVACAYAVVRVISTLSF